MIDIADVAGFQERGLPNSDPRPALHEAFYFWRCCRRYLKDGAAVKGNGNPSRDPMYPTYPSPKSLS